MEGISDTFESSGVDILTAKVFMYVNRRIDE